jgi:hypothetical protein
MLLWHSTSHGGPRCCLHEDVLLAVYQFPSSYKACAMVCWVVYSLLLLVVRSFCAGCCTVQQSLQQKFSVSVWHCHDQAVHWMGSTSSSLAALLLHCCVLFVCIQAIIDRQQPHCVDTGCVLIIVLLVSRSDAAGNVDGSGRGQGPSHTSICQTDTYLTANVVTNSGNERQQLQS